jgi:hypothetical protein
MTFKFNDEIFLSAKNIRVRKPYKKLTNRYLDFFKISEKINNNVYKLELPNQYRRLNDSFHINLLKSLRAKSKRKTSESHINR